MPQFPMPIDKNSSKHLLSKFMENAMDLKLKDHFSKAIEFIYGSYFVVKLDMSRRMYFYCDACKKEMNSVKSVEDHKSSGNHIKNEDDAKQQENRSLYVKVEPRRFRYSPDALHFKLQNATVAIIGLQYIEGYSNGKRTYFKCNLCGAHGKADAMYNHAIGNSHTEKYIKLKVVLSDPVLDSNLREYYRNAIRSREPYNVEDIIIIKGRNYYPSMWEEETQRCRQKSKRKEFEFDIVETTKSKSEMEVVKSSIPAENLVCNFTHKLILSTNGKEIKDSLEFMSYEFFNKILLKCNVILKTHLDDCSDLYSENDFKMAVDLLFYIFHLLHYTNRSLLMKKDKHSKEQIIFLESQKRALNSCMGYVHERLLKKITEK